MRKENIERGRDEGNGNENVTDNFILLNKIICGIFTVEKR